MVNIMNLVRSVTVIYTLLLITACGGGGSAGSGSNYSGQSSESTLNSEPEPTPTPAPSQSASNIAQFILDCDLNGLDGELTLVVEAINTAGVVWGPGPNPDITAVIGTGSVLYVTSGSLVSSTASYGFTGDNQFADFFSNTTNERFRVEWVITQNGLNMIINPFSAGPTQHDCLLREARFL